MTLRTGAGSFAAVDADNGDEPALTLVENLDYATECLWVPNGLSTSCDLGVFVYQPAEPITASEVQVGW